MDARVHRRPVDWKSAAVIEELGHNLETLLELVDKDINSLAVITDIPPPVAQAMLAGEIKNPQVEYIVAVANEFAIAEDDIELLAKGDFSAESDRTGFWRAHLESKGLLKSVVAEASSAPAENDASDADAELPSEVEASVDEVTTSQSDLHTLEPVWEDDSVVSLGDEKFDLVDKDVRRRVILNVRSAATAAELSLKALLEEAKLETRQTGWFSAVEKGTARIYRSELEALAEVMKTPVAILLTGHGLKPFTSLVGRKVDNSSFFDRVPTFSATDWDTYFMSRVMTPNVKLGEDVTPQDLMKVVLADKAGEPVNWPKAFMELTELGQKVRKTIDAKVESMKKTGDEVRVLVLMGIIEGLWPTDETG